MPEDNKDGFMKRKKRNERDIHNGVLIRREIREVGGKVPINRPVVRGTKKKTKLQ